MGRCCSRRSVLCSVPPAAASLKGLPIGALAGIGGATSYFVLVAVMDRRTYGSAIPAAWVITWLILAAFDGWWLRAPQRRTLAAVAGRGLAAAVIGGVSFYLVMDILWGRPPAGGRNYVVHFFALGVRLGARVVRADF